MDMHTILILLILVGWFAAAFDKLHDMRKNCPPTNRMNGKKENV